MFGFCCPPFVIESTTTSSIVVCVVLDIYAHSIAKRTVRFRGKGRAADSDFLTPHSARSRIANLKQLI